MKNFTSILGWLLLIAVLAVPSFLFYNWWSKNRQGNLAELAGEPVVGSVFPAEKNSQPPVARQSAAAANQHTVKAENLKPAESAKAAAATAAGPAAAAGPPAEQFPSASAKPPAAAPLPAQKPKISTAAEQGAARSGVIQNRVEASTVPRSVSYYNPKGDRDPTFSPEDYRRIKEAQLRRDEEERQRLLARSRKPKEPGLETRITLQGIVGNAAIINGEMYNVGQTVDGVVKILKIGSDYIIVEYKGKKFRRALQ